MPARWLLRRGENAWTGRSGCCGASLTGSTPLVRKGILKQEEIDSEMDRLYDEMESFDQQ